MPSWITILIQVLSALVTILPIILQLFGVFGG